MPTIEITLTETEALALSSDIKDVHFYLTSFMQGRARALCDEIAKKEFDRASEAGETLPSTKEALVRQAFANETVKTVVQREKEAEAASLIAEEPALDAVESRAQQVRSHALYLKITAVNALRTDGGADHPVHQASLDAIRDRYTNIINAAAAKTAVGQAMTDEEKQALARIQQAFAFFVAVDDALDGLLSGEDIAQPVHTDPRWPPVPLG